MWIGCKLGIKFPRRNKSNALNFTIIREYIVASPAEVDMAKLVLRARLTVLRLITKMVDVLERGADIQFISQTSLGSNLH